MTPGLSRSKIRVFNWHVILTSHAPADNSQETHTLVPDIPKSQKWHLFDKWQTSERSRRGVNRFKGKLVFLNGFSGGQGHWHLQRECFDPSTWRHGCGCDDGWTLMDEEQRGIPTSPKSLEPALTLFESVSAQAKQTFRQLQPRFQTEADFPTRKWRLTNVFLVFLSFLLFPLTVYVVFHSHYQNIKLVSLIQVSFIKNTISSVFSHLWWTEGPPPPQTVSCVFIFSSELFKGK